MAVTQSFAKRQRGTILLAVLLMFGIAVTIATEMAWRQRMDVLRTSATVNMGQGREYLMAVEQIALAALNTPNVYPPKRYRGCESNGFEEYRVFQIDGATIEVLLSDAQARVNVNNLVSSSPTQTSNASSWKHMPSHDGLVQVVDRIVSAPGAVPAPTLSSDGPVAGYLIDWLDSDNQPGTQMSTPTGSQTGTPSSVSQSLDGAEDTDYAREHPERITPNRPVVDVSELRMIKGFETYSDEALFKSFDVLPLDAGVNINSAPENVIDSLLPQPSNKPSWCKDRQTKPLDLPQMQSVISPVVVESTYFELLATVTMGDRSLSSRSILYRWNPNSKAIAGSQNSSGQPPGAPPTTAPPKKDDRLKVIYRQYLDQSHAPDFTKFRNQRPSA